jgi:hypothetical protein
MSRATLNDLVEDFLRLELGYGEEFVVNNEIGTLYDVEETENLEKKLSELGMFQSFVSCRPLMFLTHYSRHQRGQLPDGH